MVGDAPPCDHPQGRAGASRGACTSSAARTTGARCPACASLSRCVFASPERQTDKTNRFIKFVVQRLALIRRLLHQEIDHVNRLIEELTEKLGLVRAIIQLSQNDDSTGDLTQKLQGRLENNPKSIFPPLALAELHRYSGYYEDRRKFLLKATEIKLGEVEDKGFVFLPSEESPDEL